MGTSDLITFIVKVYGRAEFEEACRAADQSIGEKFLKYRGHDPREQLGLGSTHIAMIKKVVRHEKVFISDGANGYHIYFALGMREAIYVELTRRLYEPKFLEKLSNSGRRRILERVMGI